MFEKILEKIAKMSTRKLLTIAIPTGVVILISVVLAMITKQTQRMISIVFMAISSLPFAYCTAQLIINKQTENTKAEEERLFNEIKLVLSNEEFREVIFSPDITQRNKVVTWKNENLARCLRIVKCLKVRHFAKIADDGCIIVIARDANGETIGNPDAYTPSFFNDNYKVLK